MFTSDPIIDTLLRGSILGVIALLWVIVLIRTVGLRSLSKMTIFDFVTTLAVGSLMASAAGVNEWTNFFQATIAIASLLFAQYLLATWRKNSDSAQRIIANDPVLLMRDGEFDEEGMRSTRVSHSDVIAKLREANALDRSKVRAVVLEATGDISVLHGDTFDDRLLEGVRGADVDRADRWRN